MKIGAQQEAMVSPGEDDLFMRKKTEAGVSEADGVELSVYSNSTADVQATSTLAGITTGLAAAAEFFGVEIITPSRQRFSLRQRTD